jgi:hypothetical protein
MDHKISGHYLAVRISALFDDVNYIDQLIRLCQYSIASYIMSCTHILELPHFNPASTEKFFLEFLSDFSVYYPTRPLDMRSERNFFCQYQK